MRNALRVAVLVSCACGVAAAPARAQTIDRVLAVVGTHVITLSDVRAVQDLGLSVPGVPADRAGDVVDALVDRQLVLGEVERFAAPEPATTLVESRLAAIRARFATPAAFADALARTAMTAGRLRDRVSDDLRIVAYVDQRFATTAQPTIEEVRKYYADHQALFARNGRVPAFEDVQQSVHDALTAERRTALVGDWLARLRRRSDVMIVPRPDR